MDVYFLFLKKETSPSQTNYRGITLTAIAAKIYNLMLLNRIRPEIDPILIKNQNGFRTNRSTMGKILTIRRILEGVESKNLPLTLLFIDFSKAFDTINRKKMKEILLKYTRRDILCNYDALQEYSFNGSLTRWRYTLL